MKYAIVLIISVVSICSPTSAQNLEKEEWYLRTKDSLDIFVTEIGQGKETLVVVHGGFGANHFYMIEAVASLRDRFRIILYDQRGSLLSPAPQSKLDFNQNVQDLAVLIDNLESSKVHLLCHSMGTLVGMEYAKLYAERLNSITLVGSLPPQADSIQAIFNERYYNQVEFLENRPSVKNLEERYTNRMSPDAIEDGYYYHNSGLSDKELTELWRIRFAAVNIFRMEHWRKLEGGRAFFNAKASWMANSVNWHYDYRMALSKIPTTIIMGDHDFIDFEADRHRALIQDYPAINLIVLEESGHNPWIDDPLQFSSALDQTYSNLQTNFSNENTLNHPR